VNQPVLVSSAPLSLTNCAGGTATFSISASGTGLSYQWYRAGALLANQTNSSLSFGNVSATNAGTYSVVVGDACSDLLTNSASLVVNLPMVVNFAPTNVTYCAGSHATFSIGATGTGLSYQWSHGGTVLAAQTNSSLSLTNIGGSNAGTYSVEVSDACGDDQRYSASLSVNQPAVVTATQRSLTNCLGSSAEFAISAEGTGLSYQWFHGTNELTHETNSSLSLGSVSATNAGAYSVVVGDACGDLLTNTASLTVLPLPTASILLPTNGAVYFAPASFSIVANAEEAGGTIDSVRFFANGNSVSLATNGQAFSTAMNNMPSGTYNLGVVATDLCGNLGTSAPVQVTVLGNVPLSVNGPIKLNFQTGFYQQTATISNPTAFAVSAVGVLVENLPSYWRVQNASFVTNGVPCILYNQALPAGGSATVTIEYYLGAGASTNASPTLAAVPMSPVNGPVVAGTPVKISRAMFLNDGSFLINFLTVSNGTYFVLYSSDLRTWNTCPQPVYGNGGYLQWIDNGPPATACAPSTSSLRYYRVVLVP
jgi:hypothetical protein